MKVYAKNKMREFNLSHVLFERSHDHGILRNTLLNIWVLFSTLIGKMYVTNNLIAKNIGPTVG